MHIRLHFFDYLAFKLNIGEIVFSRYRDLKKNDPLVLDAESFSLSSNLVGGLRGLASLSHFLVIFVSRAFRSMD